MSVKEAIERGFEGSGLGFRFEGLKVYRAQGLG